MNIDRPNFNSEIYLPAVPSKFFEVLLNNYNHPCSIEEIKSYVLQDDVFKCVSDNWASIIARRCKDGLLDSGLTEYNIYSLQGYKSYLLTEAMEVGTWASINYHYRSEMAVLSRKDRKVVHQFRVKDNDRLIPRIAASERALLWFLCGQLQSGNSDFVSTSKLAIALRRANDKYERANVRETFFRLKNKIGPLESLCLESHGGNGTDNGYEGYKVSKILKGRAATVS